MDLAALPGRDPLVILGIDPGTYALGFGVIGRRGGRTLHIDHGVFRPPAAAPIGPRLRSLMDSLRQVLDHHRPDVVALEEAFVRINVQSALRLGEARAVVLLAAAERDLPVVQYPTATAKKAVCGHGGASKAAIQDMVARHLGLAQIPEPHDAADALALALCLLFDPRLDPRFAAHLSPGSRPPPPAADARAGGR